MKKDAVIALVLIAVGALFYWETFNIPQLDYASIGSEVWPRVILVPLILLSVVYLVQALRGHYRSESSRPAGGPLALLSRYRNPIACFAIFFVFLLTVDYLGMLIGGSALVFGLLTVLGHRTPKWVAVHALVAVGSVGTVWALFTFGLRAYLPQGEILQLY